MNNIICPSCQGDGKETCGNPDHGLLEAISFLGSNESACPCCGHDPNHKIRYWANGKLNQRDCYTCKGTGKVTQEEFDSFCDETGYDNEPEEIFIMNELLQIWDKRPLGKGGISEKCIQNSRGDYIGIKTGAFYPQESFYHSPVIWAEVTNIDEKQENGMIHLDPKEHIWERKKNYIGCTMPFREAHNWGNIKVYQSIWTGEYYNQNELKVL